MKLTDLRDLIQREIDEEGDKEISLYDSHGDLIVDPEFGFGIRGRDEFTFFRSQHNSRKDAPA